MTGEITARIDRTELLRLLDMTKPPAATRRTSEIAALLPRAPARGRRPTLTMPIPVIRSVAPPPPPRIAIERRTAPRVAVAPAALELPRSRIAVILERFAGFLFAGLC